VDEAKRAGGKKSASAPSPDAAKDARAAKLAAFGSIVARTRQEAAAEGGPAGEATDALAKAQREAARRITFGGGDCGKTSIVVVIQPYAVQDAVLAKAEAEAALAAARKNKLEAEQAGDKHHAGPYEEKVRQAEEALQKVTLTHEQAEAVCVMPSVRNDCAEA